MLTKTGSPGITFPVHNVERAKEALATCKTRYAVNTLLTSVEENRKASILACSGYNSTAVNGVGYHPLIAAVHLSFSQHRPLILSPDMIWITIVQGFAQHIKNNAEQLRGKFVSHAGKMELVCQRDDIFENSPESAWDEAILDLSASLETQLGPVHQQLMTDFSTTSRLERIVCAVALLDAFQPYFEYVVYCICGIPEITLEGTPSDWLRLREKIEGLNGYEIDWWLPHLRTIGDQFHRASTGDVDVSHWQDIYKQKEAYGWNQMNGWILKLIPYLKNQVSGNYTVVNPLFSKEKRRLVPANDDQFAAAITSQHLPGGIAMAPFRLEGIGKSVKMQFLGGFLGVEQDSETLALRPKLGWAVRKMPEQDSLLEQIFAGQNARPALNQDQFDERISILIRQCDAFSASVPAELMSFYKSCDGLDFSAADASRLTCRIRSLKDVAVTERPNVACGQQVALESMKDLPEEAMTMGRTLLYADFVRIGDVSDGSYVVVAMAETPLICHVSPSSKRWGVLEDSLTNFIERLINNDGRLYKDCLGANIEQSLRRLT